MSLSAPDPQLIAATNFRSVKRSDPHVKAILETSNYSVFYHYDEAGGKWEKQKQEGPLFVVQREKAPEWSLYMLNRQAVRNPAIPLVPGEMKMTVVDQGMLQVARRGEKQRLGIWFSEGPEGVNRFRNTILGICGEPSKRPDAAGVTSPPVVKTEPQPLAADSSGDDGLSRLFAGLIKSPLVQSPSVQPRVHTPQAASTPAPLARAPSEPVFSPEPTPAPVAPPQEPPIHSPSPAIPVNSPPGQTADDLLMSILGLAAPQRSQNGSQHPPAPASNQQSQHSPFLPQPQQLPVQHQHFPRPLQSPGQPAPPQSLQFYNGPPPHQFPPHPHQFAPGPPPEPSQQNQCFPGPHQHPQAPPQQSHFSPHLQSQTPQPRSPLNYRNKVGDATFAQTAALPMPQAISPETSTSSPAPAVQSAKPLIQNGSGAQTPVNGLRAGEESKFAMADSVADGLARRERDEGIRVAGLGLSAEERKEEFKRRLTDMILTDERFVDDIWVGYLDRMSRASHGGG